MVAEPSLNNVVLNENKLAAHALDSKDTSQFFVMGSMEFSSGVHTFTVMIDKIQNDCAGSGIGIYECNAYNEWKENKESVKDLSELLIGITANGSGMSSKIKGSHAGIIVGNSYNIKVDRKSQKLTISGLGTEMTADLDPEKSYIPLFTRCHGSFKVIVQIGI